jgi:hypothetical protein
MVTILLGWLQREQSDVIDYLREENRILKMQLGPRRLRLTEADRRRLARRGARLGRRLLREVATLVTPDTILRWHRRFMTEKWTYARRRPGRPGIRNEIRRLIERMATENPTYRAPAKPAPFPPAFIGAIEPENRGSRVTGRVAPHALTVGVTAFLLLMDAAMTTGGVVQEVSRQRSGKASGISTARHGLRSRGGVDPAAQPHVG